MKPDKQYGAFTLIELLTVMAVMAILVGMTLAAISKVVKRSKSAGTATLIKNIDLACRTYFNDWGKYPPDGNAGSEPDADEANNLLYNALTAVTSRSGAPAWGPYMEFAGRNLEGSSPELIIDYWGIPIVYDNNWTEGVNYAAGDDIGNGEFDSTETDNNSQFDLLSYGSDEVLGTGDDVNNWED